MKITAHLSSAEADCHDEANTPYPPQWVATRLLPLALVFEEIRHRCGDTPITIADIYRTPAHNVAVGGERGSWHLQGMAMDLHTPAGFTAEQFHALILAMAQEPGSAVGGLGRYAWGVHVDIRPCVNGALARWNG